MNKEVVTARPTGFDGSAWSRFREQGVELVVVTGPQDKDDPCLDWVGAVLSLTGATPGVPTLEQAMQDGLFHRDCRHNLAVFNPSRLSATHLAEAQARTRHAVAAMQARAEGREPPFLATRKYLREEALRRRNERPPAKTVCARTKFERVYESARKADAAGDYETALMKCRAALDLLRSQDIYGESQHRLVETLLEYMQRLQAARDTDAA
jgi:hypothetical protein